MPYRDLMPDPEFYAQCIQDSFEELRDAAAAKNDSPDSVAESAPPRKNGLPRAV